MNFTRVKIEILIPTEFVAPLRDALADVGAGKIGNYDHCVSISQVTGYWRPLEAATPYAGQVGEICSGQEAKVEVNCHVGPLNNRPCKPSGTFIPTKSRSSTSSRCWIFNSPQHDETGQYFWKLSLRRHYPLLTGNNQFTDRETKHLNKPYHFCSVIILEYV